VHESRKSNWVGATVYINFRQRTRWSVVTAFDIVTELCLIGIATFYLHKVKMWRAGKAKVLVAISSRSL